MTRQNVLQVNYAQWCNIMECRTGITTFKLQSSLCSSKTWSNVRCIAIATCLILPPLCFNRYYQLLKQGFKVLWSSSDSYTVKERTHAHHRLVYLATDLSMLRLFESFLENAPQLVLQLYIVLVHQECFVMQCKWEQKAKFCICLWIYSSINYTTSPLPSDLSLTFSFLSLAWALVDYRRCLRRSLPNTMEMPCGLPTVIYLFYKLFTITSHVLSLTLFLLLSVYSTTGLVILWLLGIIWAYLLQTNFCTSRGLEVLYRAVIGVILTFTFFNIKGQKTRGAMLSYYFTYSVINIASPFLLVLLKPELLAFSVLLLMGSLIVVCWVLGMVCLVVYYLFLHPREMGRQADEVDGCETTMRMQNFLQP